MIGNGGDNVAVLAPLFRVLGLADSVFVAAVLLVLDGVMCATALRAGRSSVIMRASERVGTILIPAVYTAIGILLLIRTGTLTSFAGHP
jgi:cadmium resistance protein CadD (predicted permease)